VFVKVKVCMNCVAASPYAPTCSRSSLVGHRPLASPLADADDAPPARPTARKARYESDL